MQKTVQSSVKFYEMTTPAFYASVGPSQVSDTMDANTHGTPMHATSLQRWSLGVHVEP